MNFSRYALTYGGLSGLVTIVVLIAGIVFGPNGVFGTYWFGYLVMLLALTFVFVGVKRYRDMEKGGVIKFLPALGMGLAIVIVAAIVYATVWEVYLAATGYRFMDDYIAGRVRELQAHGVSGAELAKKMAEFDGYRAIYANPPARFAMTMAEMLLPIGIVMPFLSALALMFPKVFPAR